MRGYSIANQPLALTFSHLFFLSESGSPAASGGYAMGWGYINIWLYYSQPIRTETFIRGSGLASNGGNSVESATTICILCNDEITPNEHGWAYGHNAQPLADGRSCDGCHWRVLNARLGMALFSPTSGV